MASLFVVLFVALVAILFAVSEFRWNSWNLEHATRHGVSSDEAEYVVKRGRPSYRGDGKWLVRGQTEFGTYAQVIYVLDDDGTTAYVIHARPLTDAEKRRLRRRRRRRR